MSDGPAGDFHDRDQLNGFDGPDAFDLAKIREVPREQPGQRTRFGDEAGGQCEDVQPAGAAAQQESEQLGVAQSRGAEFFQALLGALAHGGFAQTVGQGVLGGGGVGHATGLDNIPPRANISA